MLSTLIIFGLLALVSSSTSTSGDDIWKVQVGTSSMGRIKYEDGEVVLYQNRLKPTDIFFTPFPRVNPTSSDCFANILSGHVELSLSVELHTARLVQAVKTYLRQHFSTLCGENATCDVSVLPMSAIRLVQKGLRTSKTRQMYTINDEWHSNTLLLQTIEFVIYTANESTCEHLRSSIVERCYLSNFEIHYSLQSEKTVERQVEISTEQVTGTTMFNRIQSQFSKSDTVALTGEDFKQLISEVTDKVTMKLRVQEGFDSQIQDPVALDKLLERQLHFKQVRPQQFCILNRCSNRIAMISSEKQFLISSTNDVCESGNTKKRQSETKVCISIQATSFVDETRKFFHQNDHRKKLYQRKDIIEIKRDFRLSII